MYRRFHERFGTAGLVVAVIALIAALAGTAIAAGGLTGKQKKEVTKIAKKYAGKPGATGATGPAGPAGTNGTNGKDGANGKSVEVTEIPAEEEECGELGGALVKQEGAGSGVEVCNGAEGSPWTAGGTLPSGETLTGAWAAGQSGAFFTFVALSFTIPLSADLPAGNVHKVTREQQENEEVPAECTVGGVEGSAADPKAAPEHLCVYAGWAFAGGGFGEIFKPSSEARLSHFLSPEHRRAVGGRMVGRRLA